MKNKKAKVITVFGGVYSSLGKGISVSSIGKILSCLGYKVSILKFDPYLNVDPETMAPGQHGEVFVTADGAQTDLDLGNYERYLNRELSQMSNLTSGRIYYNIIKKERDGGYEGKTVQVVPHVTNAIKQRILDIIAKDNCDFLIIEVGGTTGDIESVPFIEALSQFNVEYGYENVLNCLIAPLISLSSTSGEYKTKPTQHAIKMLRSGGINPCMLLLRTSFNVEKSIYEKIAATSHINEKAIFLAPDMPTIYDVPTKFYEQKVHEFILDYFNYNYIKGQDQFNEWQKFMDNVHKIKSTTTIALVGKYIDLHDSYASVIEALRFAGWKNRTHVKIKWVSSDLLTDLSSIKKQLSDCQGVIVPGGFGLRGMENMINTLKYVRENNIPTMGICLGMQLMIIEYARNVLKHHEANSTEFDKKTNYPVIDLMDSTLHIGNKKCNVKKDSKAYLMYKKQTEIYERHRHRFGLIHPEHINEFANSDFVPSMTRAYKGEDLVVEFMEHKKNDCYFGSQFHPEFISRSENPGPMFDQLIFYAKKRK